MLIELQLIIFLLIAVWLAFTYIILQFVGLSFDKLSFFSLLLLWIGMAFVIYITFMIIDLQFIIFLLIALWFGSSEVIFSFLGYDPEKLSLLYYLLLWVGIIFIVSKLFTLIVRAFKNLCKLFRRSVSKSSAVAVGGGGDFSPGKNGDL